MYYSLIIRDIVMISRLYWILAFVHGFALRPDERIGWHDTGHAMVGSLQRPGCP